MKRNPVALGLALLTFALGGRRETAAADDAGFTVELSSPTDGAAVASTFRVVGRVVPTQAKGVSAALPTRVAFVVPDGESSPPRRAAARGEFAVGPDGSFTGEAVLSPTRERFTMIFGALARTGSPQTRVRLHSRARIVITSPESSRAQATGSVGVIDFDVAWHPSPSTFVQVNGARLTEAHVVRRGPAAPAPAASALSDAPARAWERTPFSVAVPLEAGAWTDVRIEVHDDAGLAAWTTLRLAPAGPLPRDSAVRTANGLADTLGATAPARAPVEFGRRAAFRARSGLERAQTPDVVGHALKFLAAHQSSEGRWESDGFGGWCDGKRTSEAPSDGPGNAAHDVGVTGVALLAFLGAGHTHRGEGPFAAVVERGLRFLRSAQDDEGCFGPRDSVRWIYNHATSTLAVVEAYGMTRDAALRRLAQRALDFTSSARNRHFGWRYGVRPGDNDTSVTGWMTMALVAADQIARADAAAGTLPSLDIDRSALDQAMFWIEKMTDPDNGRVGYQQRGSRPMRPPELRERFPEAESESMTAIGVLTRVLLGERPAKTGPIVLGAELLSGHPPRWDPATGSIDLYYWCWATQALHQLGGAGWVAWEKSLATALGGSQRLDGDYCGLRGSWDPLDPWASEGGRVYATAINALTLESPYRYARVLDRVAGKPPPPQADTKPGPPRGARAVPPWAAPSAGQRAYAELSGLPVAFENPVGMRFVLVPPGRFVMGSPPSEGGAADETLHEVELTQPFYLAVTETTNAQARAVLPGLPKDARPGGDPQPVVGWSHDEAVSFAERMTARDPARDYRLPTEAEWEYACRAGTGTPYWTGPTVGSTVACFGPDGASPRPVASFPPNGWGLHDTIGNAAEWCADAASDYLAGPQRDPRSVGPSELRALRGGSFLSAAAAVRSASRGRGPRTERRPDAGVRLVVSASGPGPEEVRRRTRRPGGAAPPRNAELAGRWLCLQDFELNHENEDGATLLDLDRWVEADGAARHATALFRAAEAELEVVLTESLTFTARWSSEGVPVRTVDGSGTRTGATLVLTAKPGAVPTTWWAPSGSRTFVVEGDVLREKAGAAAPLLLARLRRIHDR